MPELNTFELLQALRDAFRQYAGNYDFEEHVRDAFCALFAELINQTFTKVLLDATKKASTPATPKDKDEEK